MPETTPLIKAALNLRGGAGFDVYGRSEKKSKKEKKNAKNLRILETECLHIMM